MPESDGWNRAPCSPTSLPRRKTLYSTLPVYGAYFAISSSFHDTPGRRIDPALSEAPPGFAEAPRAVSRTSKPLQAPCPNRGIVRQ